MGDILTGASAASILAVILVQSLGLSMGKLTEPGPGLWPFLVAAAGEVFALTILANGLLRHGVRRLKGLPRDPSLGLVSFAIYVFLLERIGYFLPTLGLLLFWLFYLGRENSLVSLTTAVALTMAYYFVFVVWLQIPLPLEFFLSAF